MPITTIVLHLIPLLDHGAQREDAKGPKQPVNEQAGNGLCHHFEKTVKAFGNEGVVHYGHTAQNEANGQIDQYKDSWQHKNHSFFLSCREGIKTPHPKVESLYV
jgi:hypothetical protein